MSDYRGVTWFDRDHDMVWLCVVRRREEGSEEDVYRYFQHLHEEGDLLPTNDDYLRDRAEAAIRLQRGLTADLAALVGLASANWLVLRAIVGAMGRA